MVVQAHDPVTDLANSYSEPWYQIEENTLPSPVLVGNPLYGAHTYYWRARAYNSDGEYSAWSTSRSIKITPDRPTNLTLTDCAGAPIVNAITSRPCFDWDDVYGASRGYIIHIATKDTFGSSIILTATSSKSQYQPTKDLPKDRILYWHVTAVSQSYGTGLPSFPPESFTSANPPNVPVLIAPVANKLVVPTTLDPDPVFTWRTTPYPFGTTFDHYEIEIAWDKNFAFLAVPADTTTAGDEYETFYTTTLTPARTYYWHVRACNDEVPNECSSWSAAAYFRTAIGETTLVTPPDSTNPLRPIFEWSAVNNATSYTLWISKSAACNIAVKSATIAPAATPHYQPTANLAVYPTYYWCVRANNTTYGPGAWAIDGPFSVP
jgi:hypothetical protein